MAEPAGLRERKKQRTREAISAAAIELFVERGFDQVSITEVAAAAEVSRRTLFAYFPTKEDLVVARFADHETEHGRVLRRRPPGTPPLAALRTHFLDRLREHDPMTGLSDAPAVLTLYRLVLDTPALLVRMLAFRNNGERAIAEALRDTADVPELTARLAAAQIGAVLWSLTHANFHRTVATGKAAYPAALAEAEEAFALLSTGLSAALDRTGAPG